MKRTSTLQILALLAFLLLFSMPCLAQWQELEDMPTPLGAIDPVVFDGKVYVFGGKITEVISSDTVWVYDPDTGWSFGGKMPDSLEAIVIEEFEGKFYLFGGHSHPDFVYRDEVMTYDPATQQFDTVGHMPVAIAWPASAVLNGKIYIMGGDDGVSTNSKAVYVFDPADSSWTIAQSMTTDRVGVSADTLNGKIYVTGGGSLTGAAGHKTMEIFDPDPVSGGWVTSPALMNTGRGFHSCKSACGRLYVAGGGENVITAPAITATEYFDPKQEEWVVFDAMNYARRELGAAVVGDRLYVLGGRIGPFGNGVSHGKVETHLVIDAVNERDKNLSSVLLSPNSPNPFSVQTTITYELKNAADINIQVFDLNGQTVANLFNGRQGAGAYSVTWDAAGMPAGVYLYRLTTEEGVMTRKCVLQD